MSYSSVTDVARDLLKSADLELTSEDEKVLEWVDESAKHAAQRQAKLELVTALYSMKRQRKMVDEWIAASEKIADSSRFWSKVLAGATIALVLVTGVLAFVEYLRFAAG